MTDYKTRSAQLRTYRDIIEPLAKKLKDQYRDLDRQRQQATGFDKYEISNQMIRLSNQHQELTGDYLYRAQHGYKAGAA
jgi:hypothetical protein